MDFCLQKYASSGYNEMVILRYKVLREPLGLAFSDEDLKIEANDIFCTGEDSGQIVACCILTPQSADTVKLRQMAVDPDYRGKGAGKLILIFAEDTAAGKGYGKIVLHARKEAIGFYLKHGYKVTSGYFIEVGIPHVEMEKEIIKTT